MQYYSYGDEEDQLAEVTQIRNLYAAVLELAVRDLEAGSRSETVSAITWFTSTEWQDDNNDRITFTEVKDVLALNARALEKIAHTLQLAEIRRVKLVAAGSFNLRGQFVMSEDYTKRSVNGSVRRKFRKRRVMST